jgi:hypothetical protein
VKRLRFFDGQLLTAKELQAEQEYHIEKRRRHNRLLHGFGVVNGLAVTVDAGPATVVLISPGLAVDGYGNEILVESPVRIDLGVCTSDTCFVTIEFTETATDPVPGLNGGLEFSRVTEGSAARIATEDPKETTNAPQLGLARLIRADGHWVVDHAYRRPTL